MNKLQSLLIAGSTAFLVSGAFNNKAGAQDAYKTTVLTDDAENVTGIGMGSGLRILSDGNLYEVNTDGSKDFIASTGISKGQIAVDGSTTYVLDTGTPYGNIYKVSASGTKELLGSQVALRDIVVHNGNVYAASAMDGYVYKFDNQGNETQFTSPGFPSAPVAMCEYDNVFYTLCRNGEVYKNNANTGDNLGSVSIGGATEIAVNNTGMYYLNGSKLYKRGGGALFEQPDGHDLTNLTLDGDKVYVTDEAGGKVYFYNPDAILSLDLLEFKAKALTPGEGIELMWRTKDEVDVESFSIQGSLDGGRTWNEIGATQANGGGVYSTVLPEIDDHLRAGENADILVRVAENSPEGKQKIISETRKLEIQGNELEVTIYPNPTSNELNIKGLPQDGGLIQIWDMSGKEVKRSEYHGNGVFSIDVSNLPHGPHIIGILNEETIYMKQQFIKN